MDEKSSDDPSVVAVAPDTAGLEALLHGLAFPTTAEAVVAYAAAHGAPEPALRRLRNIEPGEYQSLHAVSAAFTLQGPTTTEYGHVTIYDQ